MSDKKKPAICRLYIVMCYDVKRNYILNQCFTNFVLSSDSET